MPLPHPQQWAGLRAWSNQNVFRKAFTLQVKRGKSLSLWSKGEGDKGVTRCHPLPSPICLCLCFGFVCGSFYKFSKFLRRFFLSFTTIVCQFWEEMQFFYSWFSILRRHFHTIEIHYPKNVKKLNTEIIFLSLPQTSLGFIDHWNAPVEVNCKGFIGPYDLHFKVGQKQWLVNKRNWISSGLYKKIISSTDLLFYNNDNFSFIWQ